MEAKVEAVR